MCENFVETKTDLQSHIGNNHRVNAYNVQIMKSREFIARLQFISNVLVKEKKIQKIVYFRGLLAEQVSHFPGK